MSTKLSEVCELIVDCPHSTEPDEGKGYPIIRTPDIGPGYLDLSNVQRVGQEAYDRRNIRAVPRPMDLILAREAPAGNVGIILEGMRVCLGQRTVLIRPDQAKADPYYLNYYLNAPRQRHRLLSNANGATVSHVNMSVIRNLPVDLPPLAEQKRIADVLSAYDKLIENNRKQIKLLEETVQRLYKEWFVDLRFPGYEATPIIDGLPEGWNRVKLLDMATITYGFAFNADEFNSIGRGVPIVRIRNIPAGYSTDYTDQVADSKYIVHDGELLVGMDGDFHINRWSGGDAYLVQRSCRIKARNSRYEGFIGQAIREPIAALQQGIVGSTVSHLGKKHLDQIKMMLPPSGLACRLNVFDELILRLNQQNHAAREARDRLLPKLMSGEIEV